jgi:hypothetical protein
MSVVAVPEGLLPLPPPLPLLLRIMTMLLPMLLLLLPGRGGGCCCCCCCRTLLVGGVGIDRRSFGPCAADHRTTRRTTDDEGSNDDGLPTNQSSKRSFVRIERSRSGLDDVTSCRFLMLL